LLLSRALRELADALDDPYGELRLLSQQMIENKAAAEWFLICFALMEPAEANLRHV